MTNVPEPVRKMWTDLYVFFDTHYRMENTEEAWKGFWEEAEKLWDKHGRNPLITGGVMLVVDYISERMKAACSANMAG